MNFKSTYNWLKTPGNSLLERVLHGGFWTFALRIVNRSFDLIKTIILARLLIPNDFGLFGIAMLALSSLDSFSQTGFDQALIQKKENAQAYLNSAWTIQLIRGTILAIILFIGAPLIAIFFNEPRVVLMIKVLGLAQFFKSLRNVGAIYFQKNLEFHKEFFYQFSGTLANLLVALPIAFIFRSVWALILGILAKYIIQAITSYIIHPFRPSLNFNKDKIKELINFGKWIFLGSIASFLYTQGDDIIVGKFLDTSALGLYQLAYIISNSPVTEITQVISKVTFPAYSKLQNDIKKLRSAYLKVLQITTSVSIPLSVGIIFIANDFTRIFLGNNWLPMVPAIQILASYGLLRSILATGGPIFQAKGRPDINTKLQILGVVLLAILIYPLTIKWDIVGTSMATVIYLSCLAPISFYYIAKIVKTPLRKILKKIYPPMISSAIMLLILFFVKKEILSNLEIWEFFLNIGLGVIIYISSLLFFYKNKYIFK
jgi:lipopolysaccharide exporter